MLALPLVEEAVNRVDELEESSSPEVLHKLRVALRRLRALWWAYEPLLIVKEAKLQREEFKCLANAAGRTRDWDVLQASLTAGTEPLSTEQPLLRAIEESRTNALAFSRSSLRNADVRKLLESAVQEARQQLANQDEVPFLSRFAQDRVDLADLALQKRVKRALRAKHDGYSALHEVRIAGKRLRYMLEFFALALDDKHQGTVKRLEAVQEQLGRLNDAVVSEMLLRQYAQQLGGEAAIRPALAPLEKEKHHQVRLAHRTLREYW